MIMDPEFIRKRILKWSENHGYCRGCNKPTYSPQNSNEMCEALIGTFKKRLCIVRVISQCTNST